MPSTLSRAVTVLIALATLSTFADDYPQWMGPKRDGVWREKSVAHAFPPSGPNVKWRAPVAAGSAGPAVATGKVNVPDRAQRQGQSAPRTPFHRAARRGVERILCLADHPGIERRAVEHAADSTVSNAGAPRAAATIAVPAGRVYTLG